MFRSNRFFWVTNALVFNAVLCFLASDATAQGQSRTWQSASGKFSVEASLVRREGETVGLRRDSRGVINVKLSDLSAEDQAFVNGLEIIQRDLAQYELVMPHLKRYAESPGAVMEIVEEISKQMPESPYASMMTGLAYASELGQYDKANRFFRQASQTIHDAQKVLGDRYHQQTLLSVANNLAISSLKSRKGNTAVRHLAAGVTDLRIPFSVYHNATLLMERTRQRGSYIKLNSEARKKLVGLLARKAPASPEGKVPSRFLYSLDWDEPMLENQLDSFLGDDSGGNATAGKQGNAISGAVFDSEKQLSDRGYVPYCSGSGFLISRNMMLTNRHVVQSNDNSLSYTISQYQADGSPKLVGGSIVKWSAVEEEDLALVKLDQPMDAPALPLTVKDLDVDQPITVIGYPRINDRGEHLAASIGKFIKYDTARPWFYTTNQLDFGNSGGPAVDMNGNVVGIAFAKRDYRKYNLIGAHWVEILRRSQGVSVSHKTIREFMDVADPGFDFAEQSTRAYSSRQQLVEDLRGSIMLVKSWMPPTMVVKEAASFQSGVTQLKLTKVATLRERRLYPDLYCMRCSGKGYVDCANRRCRKGGVARRATQQTGVDPLFGTPQYQSHTVYDQCSVCRGKGGAVCPDCDRGRLALFSEER